MHTLSALIAAGNLPNPGAGSPPPGVAGPVNTIVSWAAWAVFSLCVVGILTTGGRLAVAHHNGRGAGESGASLAYVLVGAVLAAAASLIIGVLV
jgi:hypothetical protein